MSLSSFRFQKLTRLKRFLQEDNSGRQTAREFGWWLALTPLTLMQEQSEQLQS
jgi:hypothetical protein